MGTRLLQPLSRTCWSVTSLKPHCCCPDSRVTGEDLGLPPLESGGKREGARLLGQRPHQPHASRSQGPHGPRERAFQAQKGSTGQTWMDRRGRGRAMRKRRLCKSSGADHRGRRGPTKIWQNAVTCSLLSFSPGQPFPKGDAAALGLNRNQTSGHCSLEII